MMNRKFGATKTADRIIVLRVELFMLLILAEENDKKSFLIRMMKLSVKDLKLCFYGKNLLTIQNKNKALKIYSDIMKIAIDVTRNIAE